MPALASRSWVIAFALLLAVACNQGSSLDPDARADARADARTDAGADAADDAGGALPSDAAVPDAALPDASRPAHTRFEPGLLNGTAGDNMLPLAAELGAGYVRVHSGIWRRTQPCTEGNRFAVETRGCVPAHDGSPYVFETIGPSTGPDEQMQRVLAAGLVPVPILAATGPTDEDSECARQLAGKEEHPELSWFPQDLESYRRFVRVFVERYDGDAVFCPPDVAAETCGADPDPELQRLLAATPTKLWQFDVEWPRIWCVGDPNHPGTEAEEYSELMAITYDELKRSDPEARLLNAGVIFPLVQLNAFAAGCASGALADEAALTFFGPMPHDMATCTYTDGSNCTAVSLSIQCGPIREQLASCLAGTSPTNEVVARLGPKELLCGDLRDAAWLTIVRQAKYDIFSFHAYGDVEDIPGAAGYIRSLVPPGTELWITEGGGPFGPSGETCEGGVPLTTEARYERQSAYLVRYFALGLGAGVRKLAWHLPSECAGWGPAWGDLDLLDPPAGGGRGLGDRRPAFYTYKLLADKLAGDPEAQVLDLPGEGVHAILFSGTASGRPVVVAWDDSGEGVLDLSGVDGFDGAEQVTLSRIITVKGQTQSEATRAPISQVPVSGLPVFVER